MWTNHVKQMCFTMSADSCLYMHFIYDMYHWCVVNTDATKNEIKYYTNKYDDIALNQHFSK